MTTVAKAIKDCIDTNWNVGTGGTEPALYNSETTKTWPVDDDWVMLLGWTFREKEKARNDSYKGVKQYIDMRVHSRNDANAEARLDEIVTEIKRIVNPTNVTGYHLVRVTDQVRSPSDRRTESYVADLTVELIIHSTSATAVPGSTATSELEVDELTVNISIAGNPTAALGNTVITGQNMEIDARTLGDGAFIADSQTNADAYLVLQENNVNKGLVIYDSSDNRVSVYNYISGEYVHLNDAGGIIVTSDLTVGGSVGLSNADITGVRSIYIDGEIVRTGDTNTQLLMDTADTIDLRTGGASRLLIENTGLTITGLLTTATPAQIDDLLMFGSANKAYVPMALLGESLSSYVRVSSGWMINTGAGNVIVNMVLPKPCNKGSLKLYISNLKIGVKDADDDDFISAVSIFGLNGNAETQLDIDATDHKTAGDKIFSGAVMPASVIDCSNYQSIIISINCSNTDASDLDFGNIRMECYYAA